MAASTNNKYIFILISSALILVSGFWLIKPKEKTGVTGGAVPANHAQAMPSRAYPSTIGEEASSGTLPVLPPSLMGTEIDCPLEVDKKGKLVLNIGLRRCFDYFFSALGEKTETQLVTDLRQYLKATLPDTAQADALSLLEKYVSYRHAEVPPALQAQAKSAEALQTSLEALKLLRLRYFTRPEAEAFFGSEEAYDQYNIGAMRVASDASLSKTQKEAKLAELAARLPPSLAKNMNASQQYDVLQKKTEEIRSRGGSALELYAVRAAIVGAEAADRLAKLDSENAEWHQRLNNYLDTRAQIKEHSTEAGDQQRAITALRDQAFSTPEDRLRAQTYESMRDAEDKRSF